MTKTQITSYTTFISLLVLLAGAGFALASEVTGTLSSDTVKAAPSGDISGSVTSDPQGNIGGTVTSQPSGSIGGTVTSEPTGSLGGTVTSGGSGGSGGSSSGGSRDSDSGDSDASDTPTGSVLGESTDTSPAPAFPNTGFAPTQSPTNQTLWSDVVQLLRNLISF